MFWNTLLIILPQCHTLYCLLLSTGLGALLKMLNTQHKIKGRDDGHNAQKCQKFKSQAAKHKLAAYHFFHKQFLQTFKAMLKRKSLHSLCIFETIENLLIRDETKGRLDIDKALKNTSFRRV